MLVAACHMIRLFCSSPIKISQATKTLNVMLFLVIYTTFAVTFLMLNLL